MEQTTEREEWRHTKELCFCWKTSFDSAEGQLPFQYAPLISEQIRYKGKCVERAWLSIYSLQSLLSFQQRFCLFLTQK